MYETRVLSGMRPTGSLHLGHYHGVLKNWIRLQAEYTCLFFVADWHALTTDYENPGDLQKNTSDMVIDWLAAGVDPGQAILFIQSQVIEHAELHLLLSMMTPLGWLERVPTYKDQQEKLADRDLSTYGFLGYPLLQSADILIYRARYVPVGEDQVPHVEFARGPRAPLRLARGRRQEDPGRARGAADRSAAHAGPRRPEDVEILRQYHFPARGAGIGGKENPHHAYRPGARKARRPRQSREMPGVGIAQGVLRRGAEEMGVAGLHHRRHRLPRVQAAGHRSDPGRAGADARAGAGVCR